MFFVAMTAIAAIASAAAQTHAARQQKKAAGVQADIQNQQAEELKARNEFNLDLQDRKTRRESARMRTRGIANGMSGTGQTLLDNVFDFAKTNEENKYWMNRDASLKARGLQYQGTMGVWSAKQKVTASLINLGATSVATAGGFAGGKKTTKATPSGGGGGGGGNAYTMNADV